MQPPGVWPFRVHSTTSQKKGIPYYHTIHTFTYMHTYIRESSIVGDVNKCSLSHCDNIIGPMAITLLSDRARRHAFLLVYPAIGSGGGGTCRGGTS